MSVTAFALSAAGVALVAALLHDVFHTLFHPEGRGTIAPAVQRSMWRVAHRARGRRPGPPTLAGPLAVTATIGAWIALAVAGWALLYGAWMSTGFTATVDGERAAGAVDAMYLSLVTLTTLGFGDVVPVDGWLKIIVPLQALVGFALLSASISWILSIQPALVRMRSFASDVTTLTQAHRRPDVPSFEHLPPEDRARILDGVRERLASVRTDLDQFPAAYWFETGDPRSSLAHALPAVRELSRAAMAGPEARVRAAGGALWVALERVAELIGGRFLGRPGQEVDEVLAAFLADRSGQDGG